MKVWSEHIFLILISTLWILVNQPVFPLGLLLALFFIWKKETVMKLVIVITGVLLGYFQFGLYIEFGENGDISAGLKAKVHLSNTQADYASFEDDEITWGNTLPRKSYVGSTYHFIKSVGQEGYVNLPMRIQANDNLFVDLDIWIEVQEKNINYIVYCSHVDGNGDLIDETQLEFKLEAYPTKWGYLIDENVTKVAEVNDRDCKYTINPMFFEFRELDGEYRIFFDRYTYVILDRAGYQHY